MRETDGTSWMDDPREQYEWPRKTRKMTNADTAKFFAGMMLATFLVLLLYIDWASAAMYTLVPFGVLFAVGTLCVGVYHIIRTELFHRPDDV